MNTDKNLQPLLITLKAITIITLVLTNFAGILPVKNVHATAGMLSIYDDSNGGDCILIGNWDNDTKTCQMIKDVDVTIAVGSGITLDGNGHSIIGPWSEDTRAIILIGDNITLRNVNVRDFDYCVFPVYASNNLTITDGTFENCDIGASGNDMRIEGNYISGGGRGISLSGSGSLVARNMFTNNSEGGILVYEGFNNLITENVMSKYSPTSPFYGYGIWLQWSSGNTIENNRIYGSYDYGIWVDFSKANAVKNNLISGNTFGLGIWRQSTSNIFYGNTIQENLKIFDFFWQSSTDNYVYNNNFVDNINLGWTEDGNAFNLSKPVGGNYWSCFDSQDEGCSDNDADGFCDSPYVFVGYMPYVEQDDFPWTKPNGWLNHPPQIVAITAPITPVQFVESINASVEFSDPDVGDTHTVKWDWGDGTTSTESATVPSVTTSHTYTSAGVYTVTATITDATGESDTDTFQYIVVYDPDGGYVIGGGWIDSPFGAYTPDPSLTGKATFGFVSKYQKGTNIPTGNTEFQFHVAGLSFKSASYDWLVIAGTKAQYKGIGTINGTGEYKFILTAIDGSLDKFRIKIWNDDYIIYDNMLGAEDTADPMTAIQGGSIVIHKTK